MAEQAVEKKHSRKLSRPFEFVVKKGDKSPRITAGANLFLHLQGGRNLVARDVTGSSDPYVVAQLGNKKFKSKIIQQTLYPRWNEVFAFEFLPTSEEKTLRFTVMDWDRLTKDDFMGECSVDLSSLELDTPAKSKWIPLEGRPGKSDKDKITGELQLEVMHVSNPAKFISEELNFERKIVLEGPVTLKKERCWLVLFNSEELAFCQIPDQKIPSELKQTGVLRNGATMKRCMSPVHQITSPLQKVCLYSEDGKSPTNPIVKDELELLEIKSMEFTSSTSITLHTTRAKPDFIMNFSNQEEAMEWFICLRIWQRSLQSISDFHSVLKKQYQEAYSGGCLKSGYNEEWQYSADGSFACIEGGVEGLKGTWNGQKFSFLDSNDQTKYGFGDWDGHKMCWWKAPGSEDLCLSYRWNRLDQEYTNEDSSWMWTRHFLANKNGAGEWITEGSVPEPFVMFLQIFYETRTKG